MPKKSHDDTLIDQASQKQAKQHTDSQRAPKKLEENQAKEGDARSTQTEKTEQRHVSEQKATTRMPTASEKQVELQEHQSLLAEARKRGVELKAALERAKGKLDHHDNLKKQQEQREQAAKETQAAHVPAVDPHEAAQQAHAAAESAVKEHETVVQQLEHKIQTLLLH